MSGIMKGSFMILVHFLSELVHNKSSWIYLFNEINVDFTNVSKKIFDNLLNLSNVGEVAILVGNVFHNLHMRGKKKKLENNFWRAS